jgi:hypothetical protein
MVALPFVALGALLGIKLIGGNAENIVALNAHAVNQSLASWGGLLRCIGWNGRRACL